MTEQGRNATFVCFCLFFFVFFCSFLCFLCFFVFFCVFLIPDCLFEQSDWMVEGSSRDLQLGFLNLFIYLFFLKVDDKSKTNNKNNNKK